MSERLGNFLWGAIFLVAGSITLLYLDAIVRLDQNSGIRLKSWFQKKLGKSVLNRELWSVGTPSGFRSSRIAFQVSGVVFLVVRAVLVTVAASRYFH